MQNILDKLGYFFVINLLVACTTRHEAIISNNNNFPVSKVSSLNLADLGFNNLAIDKHLVVRDDQNKVIHSQLIDTNGDKFADQLAVWDSIPAKGSMKYQFLAADEPALENLSKRTYCRFVPERWDDFAWENDKVAFRAYGQTCQKLFEQGNPAGLISSGIDCWQKRVDYPILDQWYKKEQEGGSYHKDDGEGLDNFHVGTSRGCGGTAIRHKGSFICSGNYSEWKILANGPLRSVFRLKYEPVLVDGKPVTETKTFTIDLGDNFYRCDVEFESALLIDTLAIGLALHNNLGTTDYSPDGWISYWEPADDSEIGMGAWVARETMLGYEKLEKAEKDHNHIWLYAALTNNKCTYYSGFGWKKAGKFKSENSWKEYIREQIMQLKNPFSVSMD